MRKIWILVILVTLNSIVLAQSESKENSRVFFIQPHNNAILQNPIEIKFGLENMNLVAAGVDEPFSGHHHLLINVDQIPNLNLPIPADSNHLHFGGGQSNITLELPPGKHTLQLLFADHHHIPHSPPIISDKISITITE